MEPVDEPEDTTVVTMLSLVDSANFNIGIPLYTGDQRKKSWTEFNTKMESFKAGRTWSILRMGDFENNPHMECLADGDDGSFGVRMDFFKPSVNKPFLPKAIADKITGLRFNVLGYADAELNVWILDDNEEVLASEIFELSELKINTHSLSFDASKAKEVVFFSRNSDGNTKFGIDDVYLTTNNTQSFSPPTSDADFLSWLKRSSFNFFDYNYVQYAADQGFVLESNTDSDKISLSGMGYAYPIFIIAGEEGYISPSEAKNRVKSMLKWQIDQNWFDGSGGWHGFPHHYFKSDGTYAWPDISTIDWAMCASGIRVAKQFYSNDTEVVSMAEELLARADWNVALAADDKIAMGFNGNTGEMNDYRWALAFSEETEIVYLEAVASGKLNADIFDAIVREKKAGFFPSWFGAGFTYNWLQLWTGAIEPYKSNAKAAFEIDASSCQEKFGVPVMGLTACSTVGDFASDGFLSWNKYISNQGGLTRLTNGSVLQISPAPYGAALGLAFTYDQSMTALREFVKMGYYHEYLGLPDNVRMRDLPDGFSVSPNWDPFDINIGPTILAIEQVQGNHIGGLFLSDPDIAEALPKLIDSFQ
ncbi:MAG: hypothetical protein ACJA08_002769 [Cyclobacteriaceae bacterium]|jgi:hypothetical protein